MFCMFMPMKLTSSIELLPTSEQRVALLNLLREASRVANLVSQYAFATKVFARRHLRAALYHTLRSSSPLSSQQLQLVIHNVADSYRHNRDTEHAFREDRSMTFDARILSIYAHRQEVSIRLLDRRERIAFRSNAHNLALLGNPAGEADLCVKHGRFYLHISCDVPEQASAAVSDVLGIDLGIVNIAASSDGAIYTGEQREQVRKYYQRRRAELQRRGTRSAKRRLKQLSRKQRNFQRNENHCIAKKIVSAASEGTKRAIALEELRGIRTRTTVRRAQRTRHSNWSFGQLRGFIEYKARLQGIPVIVVDPRNTSRRCPGCGHIDKRNRPNRATFRCRSCGYEREADIAAALNIKRAAINSAYGVAGHPLDVLQMQATASGGGS